MPPSDTCRGTCTHSFKGAPWIAKQEGIPRIAEALNQGASVVYYSGDGWHNRWASVGFTTEHVAALSNRVLPLVWSHACELAGDFEDEYPSFSEAFITATQNNGSQPTGAVATVSSTLSVAKDPGNAALLRSAASIASGRPEQQTLGFIHTDAANFMGLTQGEAGRGEAPFLHLFGDPSLHLYTAVPQELDFTWESVADVGSAGSGGSLTVTVTCTPAFTAALSTVTAGGVQLLAAADGSGTLELVVPLYNSVLLVVSSHPYLPARVSIEQPTLAPTAAPGSVASTAAPSTAAPGSGPPAGKPAAQESKAEASDAGAAVAVIAVVVLLAGMAGYWVRRGRVPAPERNSYTSQRQSVFQSEGLQSVIDKSTGQGSRV